MTYVIDYRHGGSSSGYISTGFWAGEFSCIRASYTYKPGLTCQGLTIGRLAFLKVNKLIGEPRVLLVYAVLAIACVLSLEVDLLPASRFPFRGLTRSQVRVRRLVRPFSDRRRHHCRMHRASPRTDVPPRDEPRRAGSPTVASHRRHRMDHRIWTGGLCGDPVRHGGDCAEGGCGGVASRVRFVFRFSFLISRFLFSCPCQVDQVCVGS